MIEDGETRGASPSDKLGLIYRLVNNLIIYEYDEDELLNMLKRIRFATGICVNCDGIGQDGEPSDAAGIGGWIGVCHLCHGTGHRSVLIDKFGDLVE